MSVTPTNSPTHINILLEYSICSTCGKFGKYRIRLVKSGCVDFLCSIRCYQIFLKKDELLTKEMNEWDHSQNGEL